ncbi:hypothetical protein VP01_10874g1 [Puccinia sorghi]|uniref:Uncharacterized protein n=1 Tax=Puccinia sorghi TaxID=27349 RepID=A0A0L6VT73_9BASI|nr:hypothetical protein VP01_10874g1 [Puccinia sorghi]
MSINKTYLKQIDLLHQFYNHYVHHNMLERYNKEVKESGKFNAEEEKKAIQKSWEMLRDASYKFAVEKDFPMRYRKIISDIHSHSDEEYNAKHNLYVIKTLPFPSKIANDSFRNLDKVMLDTQIVQKKRRKQRRRVPPTKPRPSIFPRPPKGVPLDFYDSEWFNQLQPNVRDVVADINSVAFLPESSDML